MRSELQAELQQWAHTHTPDFTSFGRNTASQALVSYSMGANAMALNGFVSYIAVSIGDAGMERLRTS